MSNSSNWPAGSDLPWAAGPNSAQAGGPMGQAAKDMAGYSAQMYEQAVNDAKASLTRKLTEANIKRASASLDALASL